MCNEVARRISLDLLRNDFDQRKIRLFYPENAPNMEPLSSIRITDSTVIVRATVRAGRGLGDDDSMAAELVTRRWSWPGAHGKPVYNFRSDGRDLASGRCLIPVDAFYEFTTAADPEARSPKNKLKDKWAFTHARDDWFAIAGLWRKTAGVNGEVGEAFTMLTTEPGPDVAPYHARQMVVIERDDWARWLDPACPSETLTRPLPAGTLSVTQVR
ncbi:SOS response-associated peptidase [Sphingomonas sp.]|uniref:SOS response-associated peptidase family protein n=1 Tax=Sphingomonas sp. TaxID=28214 RepID=UPI0025E9A8A5|nr:SOS response-associated peptidase [Sphingomonas sp.]